MGDKSGIEWTDATWNPIRGCSRVSEGCRYCYAEAVASRFSGEGMPYEGLAKDGKWTGRMLFVADKLDQPLRWAKPRRVFVNSMSDLFHEKVEAAWIVAIFAVMAKAKQHTFQILTKRPQLMRDWMRASAYGEAGGLLLNVWLGVSVEDEATAKERIPLLLQTPAAVRWVSYEPALGPVNFRPWMPVLNEGPGESLDWIVVGGESGPGARPFNVEWARDAIVACRWAGSKPVPVFIKQLGSAPGFRLEDEEARGNPAPSFHHVEAGLYIKKMGDRKGGDMNEWPEELRVREYPKR